MQPPPDVDPGTRYRRNREAFAELIRSLRPDELDRPVPTCPGWTVRDVVAHLAGVAADVVNDVSPGADPDAWTAAQVDARRGTPTPLVLREWERTGSQLEALLAKSDMAYPAYVLDVMCHEHDVRGAVGRPGRRDTADVTGVVAMLGGRLGQVVGSAAIPGLRVVDETGSLLAGARDAPVVLRADPFEFFRASFGRRSRAQLARRLDGTDEPDAYIALISVFPSPAHDIIE